MSTKTDWMAIVRELGPAFAERASAHDPRNLLEVEDLGARLDSIVSAGIVQGAAPGAALAVGRWGKVVHLRSYGRIDAAPDAALVTDSTLFDLASLTKVLAKSGPAHGSDNG
mgnify:CR=1 FL=1